MNEFIDRRTRRYFLKLGAGIPLAALLSACGGGNGGNSPTAQTPNTRYSPSVAGWQDYDKIVGHIQENEPRFPDRDFLVTSYPKVDPTGRGKSTDGINQAIVDCHAAGGGRVVIPKGSYKCGGIVLKSNVNLHLEEGATIRFLLDPLEYHVVLSRIEGTELMNCQSRIYACGATNIAVTGKGTLDGMCWTNDPTLTPTSSWWKTENQPNIGIIKRTLTDMGENGVPVLERWFGPAKFLSPPFVQFYACRNVLLEGVSIIHSSFWEVHPVLCENVIVRGLNINSHSANNDGCNPESCRFVLIEDCTFSTGDDCIAIKSGKNTDGRRVNVPSEYIVIRNCHMQDGHGAVTCGSECTGGIRNVFVENCEMNSPNLKVAILFKDNSRRGGVIENIFVRNLKIGTIRDQFLDVNFSGETDGDYAPILRNLQIDNVVTKQVPQIVQTQAGIRTDPADKGERTGTARDVIEQVRIRNSSFGGVSKADDFAHFDVKLEAVTISPAPLA